MKRPRLRVAFTLLAIAACLVAVSVVVTSRARSELVSFPVDLRIGQFESPLFRTDRSALHAIYLQVDRSLPSEQLNCLLGVGAWYPDHCKETPSPLDIKWSVYSPDQADAKGTSGQGRGADRDKTTTRLIGQFKGEAGKEYRLKIESLRDASILAPAHPRIAVSLSLIETKGEILDASLALLAGKAIGAVALILLLLACVQVKRSKNEVTLQVQPLLPS